jgi:hypothetical protein
MEYSDIPNLFGTEGVNRTSAHYIFYILDIFSSEKEHLKTGEK